MKTVLRCPNCAEMFDCPDELQIRLEGGGFEVVETGRLTFLEDGSAYRELRAGEERHIDHRVRCRDCSFHQK